MKRQYFIALAALAMMFGARAFGASNDPFVNASAPTFEQLNNDSYSNASASSYNVVSNIPNNDEIKDSAPVSTSNHVFYYQPPINLTNNLSSNENNENKNQDSEDFEMAEKPAGVPQLTKNGVAKGSVVPGIVGFTFGALTIVLTAHLLMQMAAEAKTFSKLLVKVGKAFPAINTQRHMVKMQSMIKIVEQKMRDARWFNFLHTKSARLLYSLEALLALGCSIISMVFLTRALMLEKKAFALDYQALKQDN